MITSLGSRLWNALPDRPSLWRDAPVSVYLIHNSPDSDDYFFLFDFEHFVATSKEGYFVRPKLELWAGRDDFDRTTFARAFRETFQQEFDALRRSIQPKKRGYFGWIDFSKGDSDLAVAAWVAVMILNIGLLGFQAVRHVLTPRRLIRQGKKEAALEKEIASLKDAVDEALTRIDITLHRELYRHAWRGQPPGKLSGMDYDAWPLPDYVRAHLEDGASSSWWQ